MNRKIHVSWILGWSSMGVLLGVILSLLTHDYFINLTWLMIGVNLVFISLANRRVAIIVIAILGGLIIGLWRGSQNYPSENVYRQFVNQRVDISGTVSDDTTFGKEGRQQIKLKQVKLNDQSLKGQIWLSAESSVEIKRSDVIDASGKLSEGFGSFSASIHSAKINKIITTKHGDIGREVRDWFADLIRKAISEPEASLGIGFLTGQHSTLPENLGNNMRILGLTHIIVASGYNLTILVRFARRWLMGVSKYSAALGSVLLIIGFIMVTGLSPSMTRAGLIAGLSLLAWYYGRRIHPLVLLPFSAALTVLINPTYLWGDLGWYLSFTSFAGVIILSPLLLNYFWGESEPNAVLRVVVETFSAQVLTAPIIAYSFGQYATLALVSNLLILPLIPVTMIATFFAGIGSVVFGSLAQTFGFPAQWLLSYMTFVVNKLANLPIAQGSISFSLSYLAAAYVFIIVLCAWLWRRTGYDLRQYSVIE